MPKAVWNTFTVNSHIDDPTRGFFYDPNRWTIHRVNGVATIDDQDGHMIDEPENTGQSDAELIRWAIIWLMIGRRDDDDFCSDNLDTCLS
jgi:hypothetical protein